MGRCTKGGDKGARVLLSGLEYFRSQIIETVFAFSNNWMFYNLPLNQIPSRFRRLTMLVKYLMKADLWYQIGGYASRGRIYKLASMLKKPVVLHWVGTDVLQALKYFTRHPEHLLLGKKEVVHWAGAPWLVDELQQIGIKARFVPLPLKSVGAFLAQEPPPLPNEFKILTYLSDRRPEFYGWNYIQRLAQDFPNIEITVIGSTGNFISRKPPNVRFLGWIKDTFNVFADCTVLVRMTEHDGYGGTVQEALSLGRYAIWSYPFPGALHAKHYSSLRDHIARLYELHSRGLLYINEAGRAYMLNHMNPRRLGSNIFHLLCAALEMRGNG